MKTSKPALFYRFCPLSFLASSNFMMLALTTLVQNFQLVLAPASERITNFVRVTPLLSELERLSPTHCWPEDNSSLTSCTQTELTSPRMSWEKDWLSCTRPTRTLSLFSVSEPNSVEESLPVSVWSTNPLLTPRDSSQPTDWLDTVWLRRLRSLLDNKESKRRTEIRRSLVPKLPTPRRLLRETLIKLFDAFMTLKEYLSQIIILWFLCTK